MELPSLTRAEHVLYSAFSLHGSSADAHRTCLSMADYLGHKNVYSVRRTARALERKGLISIQCSEQGVMSLLPVTSSRDFAEKDVTTRAIGDVLSALSASIDGEDLTLYRQLSSNQLLARAESAIDSHRPGRFHLFFRYPINKIENGLLCSKIPRSHEGRFLYSESRFVENHFSNVFAHFEGAACSVDKARWVMSALSHYYRDGKPITLNFDQEYTYHLPVSVLNTEEKIIRFYSALISLHFGNTHEYLMAVKEIFTAQSLP